METYKNWTDEILPNFLIDLMCNQNISLYGFKVKIYETMGKILRDFLAETANKPKCPNNLFVWSGL